MIDSIINFFTDIFLQWKRFWRLAEMRLLFLALLVAVVAVTSVGFFTDRADRAMSAQATQLLGGDLIIVSTRPIDKKFLLEANKRKLKAAETITFPSMVSSGDEFQLARIKAVSVDYPLHGVIETKLNANNTNIEETTIKNLKSNEVLAESRLLVSLNAKIGDVVQLGRSQVQLKKIIHKMPDQSSNAFQIAPTLLLPLDDLKETGLLTVASRASYSYLFAGKIETVNSFKDWLEPQLKQHERLRTLDDGMPSVQQALQRGQRFLKMASLLAVILAGAGIALSSYSLTQHETPSVAVLKTMGASRRLILSRYLKQLLLAATIAATLGAIIGYFMQNILAFYLQDFVGQDLPDAGFKAVWIGFLTAWVMVLGFSAPQLLRLIRISPVQILQGGAGESKSSILFSVAALSSAVLLLMWLQTQDIKLSLMLLASVLVALAVFWVMAMLMLSLIRKLGEYWRLPKANKRMALMVVVFGIGFFSLLLLTTLRTDLINRWQSSLPVDAPNHFLINIQPHEVKPIQALLAKEKIETPLYPLILARMVEINGKKVSPDDAVYEDDERAKRLLIREFNISSTEIIPEGNIVTEGEWFKADTKDGFSLEVGLAKTFNLKMGDEITFDVAGQLLTEKITSLREVKWDSMRPNFFVLTAPKAMDEQPRTFITSIHLKDNQKGILPAVIQQFPSVTDIDISAILKQVKDLIIKAALAVQAIFVFTLVSGIVVLFSALQSQKAIRRKEIAILKSLGANRAYLRRSFVIEFMMIGGLAGFLAAGLAIIAGNLAAYFLFDLNPEVNFSLLFTGMALGALLVSIAGYLNIRGLLGVLPMSLFR